MSKSRFILHARSAKTGRYVSMAYAAKHPNTTVIEKDKING